MSPVRFPVPSPVLKHLHRNARADFGPGCASSSRRAIPCSSQNASELGGDSALVRKEEIGRLRRKPNDVGPVLNAILPPDSARGIPNLDVPVFRKHRERFVNDLARSRSLVREIREQTAERDSTMIKSAR